MKHIKIPRMWEYARMRIELSAEEEAHISECNDCLLLFKACVLAESPDKIEPPDDKSRQRSA